MYCIFFKKKLMKNESVFGILMIGMESIIGNNDFVTLLRIKTQAKKITILFYIHFINYFLSL